MEEKLLLRVDEAAKLLSISRSLLYELLAAGNIKVVRIGRAVRIPRAELDRWLNEQLGLEPPKPPEDRYGTP